MSTFTGLFGLKTPRDLLEKLRRDFRRISESSTDQCAAFDLFVTAEHMVDWLYPGDGNRAKQELEKSNVLLQVCSHIASGSKHFQATAKHHRSVKDATVEHGGAWPGAFSPNAYWPGESMQELMIHLEGSAAASLGETIELRELARRVLQYWEAHPRLT